jgi:hypothetical protein
VFKTPQIVLGSGRGAPGGRKAAKETTRLGHEGLATAFAAKEVGEGLGEGALGAALARDLATAGAFTGGGGGAGALTFFWRSAIATESAWRVAWIPERSKGGEAGGAAGGGGAAGRKGRRGQELPQRSSGRVRVTGKASRKVPEGRTEGKGDLAVSVGQGIGRRAGARVTKDSLTKSRRGGRGGRVPRGGQDAFLATRVRHSRDDGGKRKRSVIASLNPGFAIAVRLRASHFYPHPYICHILSWTPNSRDDS